MDLVAKKSVLAVQNQQFAALVRVAMHHGSLEGRDLLHQFESELHFEVRVCLRVGMCKRDSLGVWSRRYILVVL